MASAARRRLLLPLLSLALGSSVALVLGEAVLRGQERRLRARAEAPAEPLRLLIPTNGAGPQYGLKPGLDLETRVERYRVPIRTNRHGMRWRDVAEKPAPGRRRIAVLGDSFTFGCWADRVENAFVSVFERNISGQRFEVLNFGVGGYGVDDMELQLAHKVMPFAPDYVLVALFTGNDFRDTYLGPRKYHVVDGTARLDDDNLERKVPEEFRRAPFHSSPPAPETRPLQRALARFALYRALAPPLGLENLALDFKVSQRFISYTYWSQVPFPPLAQQAVDETLAALGRMDELLRPRRIRLALAVLPTKDQVYSRREFGPDFDVALPQAQLRVFAAERDIPYLDLLQPLRRRVHEDGRAVYLKRDTHFDNEGHRVVGEALAEWFRCCVKQANRPLQTD